MMPTVPSTNEQWFQSQCLDTKELPQGCLNIQKLGFHVQDLGSRITPPHGEGLLKNRLSDALTHQPLC